MTKQFKVVLSYDVQRTIIVEANNEDDAFDKAYKGQGDLDNDNWEYIYHIETMEEKIEMALEPQTTIEDIAKGNF
jgi:hypothetical protein